MAFKPSDFFIGLAEFISIVLPGAFLSGILLLLEATRFPIQNNFPLYMHLYSEKTNAVFWVALVLSSFGLGYFLSSIASGLDPLYDAIRKQFAPYKEDLEKAYEKQVIKHQKGSLIIPSFEEFTQQYTSNKQRKFLALVLKLNTTVKTDESYEEAKKLINEQHTAVGRASNTCKWAGTILEAAYPAINMEVTRTMAASKFFRSMVIVTILTASLQAVQLLPPTLWLGNLLLLMLSFREYIVQRQKAVLKTYQSIVTLNYYYQEHIKKAALNS